MNELLAKLTNISYELFGVMLPGVVASLFLLLLGSALGPLVPTWTLGNIPEFSITGLGALLDKLGVATGIGTLIPLIAIWYVLGQLLLWFSISRHVATERDDKWPRRLALTLTLRVPVPTDRFDPKLQPLFDAVRREFSAPDVDLDWRRYYPVAKSFLSREVTSSLVATYQNKYTFHRSVATASAMLSWASAVALVGGVITFVANGTQPHWFFLTVLLVAPIFISWGFCGSYLYHWEMFGNTIITETYSVIYGPRHDDSSGTKSFGRRSGDDRA